MASFRKSGSKWRAEVRRKGIYKSKVFYTKAEALEWSIETEKLIDRGQITFRGKATLADAMTKFSKEVSPKHKGCRWEQVRLRKLSRDEIADYWLQNLTKHHIFDWRKRRAEEVAPGSVNRELGLLKSVLEVTCQEWGWITTNPARGVGRLPTPRGRDRRISDEEILTMCWSLGYTDEKPRTNIEEVSILFLLALETGMRLNEMCTLAPDDIHLDRRKVVLRDSKNGDAREVPLTKEAVRLLGLLDGQGFNVGAQQASVIFTRHKRGTDIVDLRFHDTRHEACTRLAQKLSPMELARMMGHRSLKTTLIYYNESAEDLAKKLD